MKVLNGKGRTVALVVVVFAVWGVIAVQVLNALGPTNEVPPDPRPAARFELDAPKPKDTFAIDNNYRDPFSGKLPPGRSTAVRGRADRPKKEPVQFPEVRYQGAVSNAAGRDMVFSLSVDGRGILLSAGGSYREIRLLKGDAGQVVLEFKGKRKTFNK